MPGLSDLILSGDTGNGYRAYEMLEALSAVFEKFKYSVKLIPLAPGHAWNRTDARIAHMNTFLKKIKALGRVFGAKEIADAFERASSVTTAKKRNWMARSHTFFREVTVDEQKFAQEKKMLGRMLQDSRLDKGHMGVKGFLYFDFSFQSQGGVHHPRGHARVREYADPDMFGNPTYVWSWRTDLAKCICQPCSNREVRA